MPAWLASIVGPLVRLLRRPQDVAKVVEAANEIVEAVTSDAEPSQPLTYKQVEHIRQQVDSATKHGVTLPGPVKAIDRSAKTPPARPPRIEKKGDK
jgi:hypothetical protein